METNEKKLLILGAGRGQIGLYKAARDLGIKTIAGTMPDNDPPGIKLADEVCYMNILNPDEVETATKDISFDGVATSCLDKGLRAMGRLNDIRSTCGYGEETAMLCNDKSAMKRVFEEHGVNTAKYKEVSNEDELDEAIEYVGGYPVIIKATDLAGSIGINKAFNREEAHNGFRLSMEATKRDYIIVEKLLQGREFGAQAFISNGKLLFVMPHGDILFHGATDVPIGHYVPFDCDDDLKKKIGTEAEKAIRAIGLDNCAVNLDFIEEDGDVYVLELSGRIGANGLPEVVSAHFGIDYYKMVVLAALGESVDSIWETRKEPKAALSKMIISTDLEGVLKTLTYAGDLSVPELFEINLFAKPNSKVNKFANSSHCLGEIVVTETSVEKCLKLADEIAKEIKIEVME